MFLTYRRLLRTPGMLIPLAAMFAGAVPLGMMPLGLLLLAQRGTGSLSAAALVVGVFTAGTGVGVVLQGYLIDRCGIGRVLLPAALVLSLATAAIAVEAGRHGSGWLLGVSAIVAGASQPATTSAMRVLLPGLVSEGSLRLAGYALHSILFQVAILAGPLLVSGIMALASPIAAVVGAGAVSVAATLVFASAPSSRKWRPHGTESPHITAALGSPGVRTLVAGGLAGGLSVGLVSVAVPSVALAHDAADLAGVLLAIGSAGELAGGLAYGARPPAVSLRVQLIAAQAGLGVVVAACAPVGILALLGLVLVVRGMLIALQSVSSSALLDDVAPVGALTGSYTLVVAAGLAGMAAGSALAGPLAVAAGPALAFAAAGAAVATGAALTFFRRHTLVVR